MVRGPKLSCDNQLYERSYTRSGCPFNYFQEWSKQHGVNTLHRPQFHAWRTGKADERKGESIGVAQSPPSSNSVPREGHCRTVCSRNTHGTAKSSVISCYGCQNQNLIWVICSGSLIMQHCQGRSAHSGVILFSLCNRDKESLGRRYKQVLENGSSFVFPICSTDFFHLQGDWLTLSANAPEAQKSAAGKPRLRTPR